MNLVGIKNRNNKRWRISLFYKLDKLGFSHIPSPSLLGNGYIIITPDMEYKTVHDHQFDIFMFPSHYMYEARNEKDFFNLIQRFFTNESKNPNMAI